MTKRNPAFWKITVLALALLAVPMLAGAARLAGPPPQVPANPVYPQGLAWNPVVDYTKPNFAQSPNIRKFVDSLPGLGAANANNLGQYIPVAVPDTTSYKGDATGTAANPASDYYQIEVKECSEQVNSDLPPTTLRGYAQINGPAGAPNGVHHNLGPAIIAKTYDPTKPTSAPGNGKPVRIKFINNLTPGSLLPLPVDTTIMGAGMGPLNASEMYSQNRATVHLHGGATPWISDGTPHQWITPASVQATAVATVSGGTVNAITVDEPGANYTNTVTVPTCTVSAPTTVGGVTATCSVMTPTANTVGSIVLKTGGSGYTRQPQVFLIPPTGSNGLGATATAMLANDLPMTGKNLTEGFDAEYGRMDVRLGSTPNPLTPGVGAGFVVGVARYIDPPTEILNDGETIIWRLSHLGVDSHAMHFHLFNMQVVNRVDWTNVLKPPYPEEIGWKETIRTNPMEDLIVAIRPTSMILPFPIGDNNRVLDPTTPLNSTTNFYPVAPPAGVTAVAQQTNAMTNFGWEYVWHCHLLGHEENDMMRPMVLSVVPPPAPTALTASMPAPQNVVLTWADTALNLSGYTIQRSTTSTFTPATAVTSLTQYGTALSYTDAGVATNQTYYYRVLAFNPAGSSLPSNVVTVAVPAAPSNLTATIASATQVNLSWTDNSNNETGFAVWRSVNAAAATQIATVTRTPAQGTAMGGAVTYNNTGVAVGNTYAYYVTALTATDASAASNTATVTLALPTIPINLAAVRNPATQVVLTWANTSASAASFTVQRATNATFGAGLATLTPAPGPNATSFIDTTAVAATTYYYRVRANNVLGSSNYVSVGPVAPPAAGIGINIDANLSTNVATVGNTITSASVTTHSPNELLLAFIAASDPGTASSVTGVTNTGGALTWVRVQRTNTQHGTAEIWRAFAPTALTGTVTATLNQNVSSRMITVVSFTGVDTTGTSGSGAVGATASGNALTGAPTASLVTTRPYSWVFGVGNDWSGSTARTLGANQTSVSQFLSSTTNDTYWVQRQNVTTPFTGTTVTINDTAPTNHMYNLSVVEVRTP